MRPAQSGTVFVLAFEAGLATGLSHFWGPACAIITIGLVVVHSGPVRFAGFTMLLGLAAGRTGHYQNAATCPFY